MLNIFPNKRKAMLKCNDKRSRVLCSNSPRLLAVEISEDSAALH